MANEVVKFLKAIASTEQYQVFDAMFGQIHIGTDFPIRQSSGAVYGIWAQCNQPPSTSIVAIPGLNNWYPMYWGKDISPVSRVKAHVQGHKNGNLGLTNMKEVRDIPLIFGAILVARYCEFEKLLHKRYPPLKGSSLGGRSHTVVSVEN